MKPFVSIKIYAPEITQDQILDNLIKEWNDLEFNQADQTTIQRMKNLKRKIMTLARSDTFQWNQTNSNKL